MVDLALAYRCPVCDFVVQHPLFVLYGFVSAPLRAHVVTGVITIRVACLWVNYLNIKRDDAIKEIVAAVLAPLTSLSYLCITHRK